MKDTFRKYGIQVYINDDNQVTVINRGLKLSVHPFFFKNTLSIQSRRYLNPSGKREKHQPQVLQSIVDDAGIAIPLNQTIFDIFARSRYLASLSHKNLVEFITVESSKKHHDQVLVISEDYSNSLSKEIEKQCKTSTPLTSPQIALITYQILNALSFLHKNNLTHRNLSIENIKFDNDFNVKLSNYGLYFLSNNGENVTFPIGNLCYLSPESILMDSKGSSNPKSDVWALGCILLNICLGFCIWNDNNPNVVLNRILYLSGLKTNQTFNSSTRSFETIDNNNSSNNSSNIKINNLNRNNIKEFLKSIEEFSDNEISGCGYKSLDPLLKEIIEYCLIPNPLERPDSRTLFDHPYFNDIKLQDVDRDIWLLKPYGKSEGLPDDLSTLDMNELVKQENREKNFDIFSSNEVYYLWKLMGGDIEKELVSQGLMKPSPSVHKLPLFVPIKRSLTESTTDLDSITDNNNNNNSNNSSNNTNPNIIKSKDSILYNSDQVCLINIDQVILKLKSAYGSEIREMFISDGNSYQFNQGNGVKKDQYTIEKEILILKEYHKLLHDYQYEDPTQAQPKITKLAKYSIPPLLRGDIWAAILGVNDNEAKQIFYSINLDQKGPNDKQFELDIPRCHQYHPLLSSEQGHIQLFRVLKAWSLFNIEYGCYWQGLDSVCATFVVHHFHNESKAFATTKAFVDKYLKILYVPNNFSALSEIMLVYQQLLSYHDPEVSVHLKNVQFEPDLYAIPWFITIFAHLLPIDKIECLWDTVLLGPSSLPFFIAASIMIQFRSFILSTNSEDCLRIIPKISSLDVDVCVKDAQDKFNLTPLSTTINKFVPNTDIELWWMQDVPIEKRKRELFPRIAIQDLINPCTENTKIIDIRPQDQFKLSHYPNSINVNYKIQKVTTQLEQLRNKPIVVIAPSFDEEGIEFCNQLVHWKFKYVSLLNGGIEAIEHGASSLLIKNDLNK